MKNKKVSFTNKNGDSLSGRLELPISGKPAAYAIFAHCFTCTKNIKAAGIISRALAAQQIATLRFDFTGLGQSAGDFAESTFSSDVADLICAAQFLEQQFEAPQLLVGHSLGGAAVLHAASSIDSAKAVVTIGSPFDPQHVTHLLSSSIDEINQQGEARVNLGGQEFTVKKSFIDDLKNQDPAKTIGELNRALLILHSPTDTTVSIDSAAKIYSAARHPKSFITLDPADHLLMKEQDARYAAHLISTWAQRYMILEANSEDIKTEENVIISKTGTEGFYTEINANGHSLVADEPSSVGGSNLGPTPYDYLMASISACTTMTLQMYAKRKGIQLNSAKVRVTHSKVYAQDCETCETSNQKIDKFTRELELEGELTDQQAQRMLEIADKCPVHKTLHSNVQIETTLKKVEDSATP